MKKGRWLACYCPVAPDQLSFGIVEGREDNEIIYISHKLLDNNQFEDEEVRQSCRMSDVLAFHFQLTKRGAIHKVLLRKLLEKVDRIERM